jgi:tRNA-uridine 2-sulfurtransferase
MKKVVVGLSGGVDSIVAAYLLLQKGCDVIGVFMKNWHDSTVLKDNECPWVDDSNDALLVAEHLGIPFQTIDLSEAYKKRIVDYMFAEYEAGRTPNPDVLCNREIKFSEFLNVALALGADYVATGHYCQNETGIKSDGTPIHRLLAGADANKDQSYFLCQVNQNQLSKALFPIGGLQKSEVRKIATEIGLPTAQKKDSQGLCFVGKISLPEFLQQQLKAKTGDAVLIPPDHPVYKQERHICEAVAYHPEMGKKVGEHQGAHFYTVGQRKGLRIGGFPEPLFVIGTDVLENIIYLGMGENHPGLLRKGLFVPQADIHWVRPDLAMKTGDSRRYSARIRYRQPLQSCTLTLEESRLLVVFDEPQKAITPGQFVAWYDGNELIGSGVIQA